MRTVVITVAILALVIGLGVLGKRLLWPERLDNKVAENIDVDLSLKGVELSQGRQGKKLWNLKAQSANYAESADEVTLTFPIITYWGDDEGQVIHVTAPRGQVWQKEDRARLWDGVNATRADYQLTAVDVNYSGKARELLLTGDVHVIGKKMQARSDALTYFLESGDFTAQGNVTVTMN